MPSATEEPKFQLQPYSEDNLCGLLAKYSGASLEVVRNRPHFRYFKDYFEAADISARTILAESDYVDRHFLEDYASFHVRCFHPYKHLCTRLHFFRDEISSEDIERALRRKITKKLLTKLRNSYLGFIVVKPLPETIIGRTCLVTYSSDDGRRHFPITRPYRTNLFGIELEIRNTLAFQEQDKTASACATSALWSTFQGTGRLFQHSIPSPVEITKAALSRFPMSERGLPSHGLARWQMAHAICSVGLEPHLVRINDEWCVEFALQSVAYAYLRGGIPVPLVTSVYDASEERWRGQHAVALTGFSLGKPEPDPYGPTGLLLKASRIDKFYAHDDSVGPFARMELCPGLGIKLDPITNEEIRDDEGEPVVIDVPWLSTSWGSSDAARTNDVRMKPEYLLVPLYHKIRIPFSKALGTIVALDEFLKLPEVLKELALPDDVHWDIYLTEINKIKSEIVQSDQLKGNYRRSVLLAPMPKYIWRATAEIEWYTLSGHLVSSII